MNRIRVGGCGSTNIGGPIREYSGSGDGAIARAMEPGAAPAVKSPVVGGDEPGIGFAGQFSLKICEGSTDGRQILATPPMDRIEIVLDGTLGMMELHPLTEREWWSLSPGDRPGSFHYHPQLKIYFGIRFRENGQNNADGRADTSPRRNG
jgi:hypothetical protein